ncbi:MAG: cobyric acid synthase, partial [Desulfobacterales bacterium]|nr:cobyric acid synthase [Desulfobacterales bacterium]
IPEKYREMVKGFIINRFRGDIGLFDDGVNWIEAQTGKKVFGVLPWYSHFRVDAEDSVEIEKIDSAKPLNPDLPTIAVLRLPHIANFTDFHALSRIKGLQVLFIDSPQALSTFNAVIIPGSKNTREDLDWVKNRFETTLKSYVEQGGHVLGICGGYQMLGRTVEDPNGLEGTPGISKGLDLLPVETVLKSPKTTTLSKFEWEGARGRGYEIHMGYTRLVSGKPFIDILSRNTKSCSEKDGCISSSGRVAGTYIHGFFDSGKIATKWFRMIGLSPLPEERDAAAEKERDYGLLKSHMETYIDMETMIF